MGKKSVLHHETNFYKINFAEIVYIKKRVPIVLMKLQILKIFDTSEMYHFSSLKISSFYVRIGRILSKG